MHHWVELHGRIADHDWRGEAMKRQRSGVAGSFSRNHEMGSQRNLSRVLGKLKEGNFAEDLVLVYRACAMQGLFEKSCFGFFICFDVWKKIDGCFGLLRDFDLNGSFKKLVFDLGMS